MSTVRGAFRTDPAAPLRVGIVLGQLDLGGSEGQALALAAGLRRRGHDVRAFSFRVGPRREQATSLGVPCRVSTPGGGLFGLSGWLRAFRPEAVYTFTFRGHLFGRLVSRLHGTPRLLAGYRQYRFYWFDRWSLSWNHAVVCNCRAVADLVAGRYSLPPERLRIIPNGVDLERFTPGAPAAGLEREGLDPRRPTIVQVARFHPNKDHETALRAFALVLESRPDAQLAWVGEGPRQATLRAMVEGSGLGAQVRFLSPRLDVAPFLAAARLGWLSSRIEGSPNAVLEYMAAGLPVVATRAGGTAELLRDAVDGFLVEPGDAGGLARHTLELLADEQRREAMGRAGRQRAREEFGLSLMVDRSEALLLELRSGPVTNRERDR